MPFWFEEDALSEGAVSCAATFGLCPNVWVDLAWEKGNTGPCTYRCVNLFFGDLVKVCWELITLVVHKKGKVHNGGIVALSFSMPCTNAKRGDNCVPG